MPADLRTDDPGDEDFAALMRWADPDLPDSEPDPYERGLTPAEVAVIAQRV